MEFTTGLGDFNGVYYRPGGTLMEFTTGLQDFNGVYYRPGEL